jgi:hypothetical protein
MGSSRRKSSSGASQAVRYSDCQIDVMVWMNLDFETVFVQTFQKPAFHTLQQMAGLGQAKKKIW